MTDMTIRYDKAHPRQIHSYWIGKKVFSEGSFPLTALSVLLQNTYKMEKKKNHIHPHHLFKTCKRYMETLSFSPRLSSQMH